MPYLSKKTISAYFRTSCKRQLRLLLSPENAIYQHERDQEGMPPKQDPRPGLSYMHQAGKEWEVAKFSDIEDCYGIANIIGNPVVNSKGETVYSSMALLNAISQARPGNFLIESEFDIRVDSTFEQKLDISILREDFNLAFAKLRPDIIQVLPPMTCGSYVTPKGEEYSLPHDDTRKQLKVIDVKHTAEPSVAYFAEVTYYMMALAGWLEDEGLSSEFVVVSGAVWPGSHDASTLRKVYQEAARKREELSTNELNEAMNKDLEDNPFGVFASRLRRFFVEELKEVLSKVWDDLPFHITNKCGGCAFLGYPWRDSHGNLTNDPDHCMPTAERINDLSRIPQLSFGASNSLRKVGINDINALANVANTSHIFDRHQTLKAKRVIIPIRAQSLLKNSALLSTQAGTSAVMPKWSDLSIYVSVDFDITSGITVAFGLKAFWIEPIPFGQTSDNRRTYSWPQKNNRSAFIVDRRDLNDEKRELLVFLKALRKILSDAQELHSETKMQIYIWDQIQLNHLQRIIGRHLAAILAESDIADLTWLFPPENVIPNHNMQRRSPITVMKEVITALTALPVPHYYSLLQTARVYHPNSKDVNYLSVHPLFEDFLSDQIPSERAHEIWNRSIKENRHWMKQMHLYEQTVTKRLSALEDITRRVQKDLRSQLQEQSPTITISAPRARGKMSADGELWYAFSKLNARVNENEVLAIRALSIEEREAKFHSAKLTRRLVGTEEIEILSSLGLSQTVGRRVYELAPNSKAVKMKEGDFLFALSPSYNSLFLNQNFIKFTQGLIQINKPSVYQLRMEYATGVTVKVIDRENGILVIDVNLRENRDLLQEIEDQGLANFSQNVSIDPISTDFFTKKLEDCLKAIGNPEIAERNPLVIQALGQRNRRGARRTEHTPAADILWDSLSMNSEHSLFLNENCDNQTLFLMEVKGVLEQRGVQLTPTQWGAWEGALKTRLQLIWGPPGTGKSRTLRAVIMGAIAAGALVNKPIRLLICAQTYTAVDNVLIDVSLNLRENLSHIPVLTTRLRSSFSSLPEGLKENDEFLDVETSVHSPNLMNLITRLKEQQNTTVVGATPEQVYNLLKAQENVQEELFDMILIDEASQMDVAHAILPLCSLADKGSVILAGDPKQLAPIHQAEAPVDLEDLVGDIYSYMKNYQGVNEVMLDRNYRSSSKIVELGYEAGYIRSLTSNSPNLKLSLTNQLPINKPSNWPESLYWTNIWTEIMDPEKGVVCFVYPDGKSSQWNDFEVDAVASLIKTIHGQLAKQLENELDTEGNQIPLSNIRLGDDEFWQRGIGIVTPHRAQQSKLVTRLQGLFGSSVSSLSLIRDAVDTVERFQGQQRDIIIASYALGDPDLIADEEEFLMSLNRFNVIASRARAKLIVLLSQEIIDHLASDIEVLRESRLLKVFADSYCSNSSTRQLGYYDAEGNLNLINGSLRYK
ncbi:DEAD/DEAH box helicase [Priestia megaterium]|uniref:DEAD/DEAH box helicase n=1 Tax=Priestia megaterium TaxID=1404 RepID=UPI0035CBC2BC